MRDRVTAIVVLLLSVSAPAAAQDSVILAEDAEAVDAWAYDRPDVLVTSDFSFFTGSQVINGLATDFFAAGFVFAGHVRVFEDLWIDAAWGFAHGSFTIPMDPFPIGGRGTRVGNPYLGASYVIDAPPVRMTFAVGATIPISETPDWDRADPMDFDDLAGSLADRLVARIEGNVRPWLYLPRAFSIVARGRVESVGPLLLAADVVVAPMFATGAGGVYSGDSELVLVPAGEIGWRPSPWLSLGARGQAALFPTEMDETLGSIEPFIQADKRDVGHFRLGFLVQLGGPNDSSFADSGLWALRLTAGMLF